MLKKGGLVRRNTKQLERETWRCFSFAFFRQFSEAHWFSEQVGSVGVKLEWFCIRTTIGLVGSWYLSKSPRGRLNQGRKVHERSKAVVCVKRWEDIMR